MILYQIDISSLPAGEERIKVKTKRMKSKDRHLGVLNMPEATEVGLLKGHLDTFSGGCGQKVETEQEKKETAHHISQDHCKQDLFHHQPTDEGRIKSLGDLRLALLSRWKTL